MSRRLTINQIANELSLSRNTVAKVLNGKPGVSEKTKHLVLLGELAAKTLLDQTASPSSPHLFIQCRPSPLRRQSPGV